MKIIILLIFIGLFLTGAKKVFDYLYFKYKWSRLDLDKDEDLLEAITMFYGKAVKEYKNAKVIFMKEYDPKNKGICYDFSLWEEKGIIGVVCTTDKEQFDGEMGLKFNQTVYKFKGGHCLWLPK